MKNINPDNLEIIKKLLSIISRKHEEITFFYGPEQLKKDYIEGVCEGKIEWMVNAGSNNNFFDENGDFEEANIYANYTTCSYDDITWSFDDNAKLPHIKLDQEDKNILHLVDALINDRSFSSNLYEDKEWKEELKRLLDLL